jgi:hypothetical protein
VAKIGDSEYETFAAAYANANDGDTIDVIADSSEQVNIKLNKSINIKLDANLELYGNGTGIGVEVTGNVTLTISGAGKLTLRNFEDGIFNGNNECKYGINLQDSATLYITECKSDGIKTNGDVNIDIGSSATLDCSGNYPKDGVGTGIFFTNGHENVVVNGTLRCCENGYDGIYCYYSKDENASAVMESMVVDGGKIVADGNFFNGIVGNVFERPTFTLKNGAVFEVKNNKIRQGSVYVSFDASDSQIYANGNYFGLEYADINSINTIIECNNNRFTGWHLGKGESTIDKNSTVTISGNSIGSSAYAEKYYNYYKDNPGYYDYYLGAVVLRYSNSSLTVDSGAKFSVTDNFCSGIRICNSTDSVILNGGIIAKNGQIEDNKGANYGGGIYNTGTLTLSSGAVVCNNHAAVAGDDIYNTGTMTLVPASGFNAVLDDCGHGITGWYYDGIKNGTNTARWNVSGCISGREEYIDEYSVLANDANTVALKATHGTIPVYVPVIVDPTPIPTPTPTPSETIPDENVPATDIPEPNTPKADASAQVTGDSGLIVWSAVTAAFSIAGLAYLSVSAKKRGE